MEAILELDDVSRQFGGLTAVRALSFSVRQGEIVALIGANGSGKTTTLATISSLLSPAKGGVFFEGKPLHEMPAHEIVSLGIVHVPEGRRLFPRLRERARQQAGTLSGGEQQMAAIGRGLMSRPRLLMLDEPSLGLSPLFADAHVKQAYLGL